MPSITCSISHMKSSPSVPQTSVCSPPHPWGVSAHQDIKRLGDSNTQSLFRAWTALPEPCPWSPWIPTAMGGPGGPSTGGDTEAQGNQGPVSITWNPRQSSDLTFWLLSPQPPKAQLFLLQGPEALVKPSCTQFQERRLSRRFCEPVLFPARPGEEWETHPSGGRTRGRPGAGWTSPCSEHLETPDQPPHSARPPVRTLLGVGVGEERLEWVGGAPRSVPVLGSVVAGGTGERQPAGQPEV